MIRSLGAPLNRKTGKRIRFVAVKRAMGMLTSRSKTRTIAVEDDLVAKPEP